VVRDVNERLTDQRGHGSAKTEALPQDSPKRTPGPDKDGVA
jgi:hypothetical protein